MWLSGLRRLHVQCRLDFGHLQRCLLSRRCWRHSRHQTCLDLRVSIYEYTSQERIPVQNGRVYIELVNAPFLKAGGTAGEYRAGMDRAIAKGWLVRHESGTVRFTETGVATPNTKIFGRVMAVDVI